MTTAGRHSGITVVTRGDRVEAMGPDAKIPGGATRVNGTGKFLIPGRWDMHTHHQGTGTEWLDLFVAMALPALAIWAPVGAFRIAGEWVHFQEGNFTTGIEWPKP